MPGNSKVALLLETSRKSSRSILRGITLYSQIHGPWIFYRQPPFYRNYRYSGTDRSGQSGPSDWLKNINPEGVITYAADSRQLKKLLPVQMPSVLIPIEEIIPGSICLLEKPQKAGALAAEHFLDRGFENFAYCGLKRNYWSNIRLEGYRQRLLKDGHKVDVSTLPLFRKADSMQTELSAIIKWLKSLPKPVAIMVCNDDLGREVIDACQIAELKVPEQIAVLGVDDDDMICELTNPPLSSIAMDFEKAGFEAAKILDKQMSGTKVTDNNILLEPIQVVCRQSTDILAIDDAEVSMALQFIRANAEKLISVQDVVSATSLSRRLLERRFRKLLNSTILEQIQRTHIQRVCQMLIKTDWLLKTIAAHSGFSSATHLGVVFKKQMDLSPAKYRRLFRNN